MARSATRGLRHEKSLRPINDPALTACRAGSAVRILLAPCTLYSTGAGILATDIIGLRNLVQELSCVLLLAERHV